MKRFILLSIFLIYSLPVIAQTNRAVLSDTIYNVDGSPAANATIRYNNFVSVNGEPLLESPKQSRTSSAGVIRLKLWKNSSGYIWVDSPGWRGDDNHGVRVIIPNRDTVQLGDIYGRAVIVIDEGQEVDTTGLTNDPRMTNLEIDVATAGTWDTYTSGSYEVISPKISDTTKTKIDNNGNMTLAKKAVFQGGLNVYHPESARDDWSFGNSLVNITKYWEPGDSSGGQSIGALVVSTVAKNNGLASGILGETRWDQQESDSTATNAWLNGIYGVATFGSAPIDQLGIIARAMVSSARHRGEHLMGSLIGYYVENKLYNIGDVNMSIGFHSNGSYHTSSGRVKQTIAFYSTPIQGIEDSLKYHFKTVSPNAGWLSYLDHNVGIGGVLAKEPMRALDVDGSASVSDTLSVKHLFVDGEDMGRGWVAGGRLDMTTPTDPDYKGFIRAKPFPGGSTIGLTLHFGLLPSTNYPPYNDDPNNAYTGWHYNSRYPVRWWYQNNLSLTGAGIDKTNPLLTIHKNGIGVGTLLPIRKLDVTGSASISDTLIAESDIQVNAKSGGRSTFAIGDSVQVSLTGALNTDFIVATYQQGNTAPTIQIYWKVNVANTITFYGDNGREFVYHRFLP